MKPIQRQLPGSTGTSHFSAGAVPPAQRHLALIWLIRGTGALIALCSAIIAFGIVAYQFERPDVDSWISRIVCSVGVFLFVLLFGFISKRGCDMSRKLNPITLADFSSVFALFVAVDWYQFLPPHLPKAVVDYFGSNPFFYPFDEQRSPGGLTYRAALSYVAFFIFYKLIKASLLKILDLNPPASPQNPVPLVPSVPPNPSDPFVPFDPYNLSKNSPYRPPSQP